MRSTQSSSAVDRHVKALAFDFLGDAQVARKWRVEATWVSRWRSETMRASREDV